MRWKFLAIVICLLPFAVESRGAEPGAAAPKPLYRDPVYDGAADAVVIWNPQVEKWWMFYTNRRANAPNLPGVSWVHGTPIGIAESADGGVTWKYVGDAKIESPDPTIAEPTWWAPDVIRGDDGQWHMFLTVVPGVFTDWHHPRNIVHYTSSDLRNWTNPRPLKLANEKVIDATVFKRPDGSWRMFYNNERDNKSIYFAESPDLTTGPTAAKPRASATVARVRRSFAGATSIGWSSTSGAAWACSAQTMPRRGRPSRTTCCSRRVRATRIRCRASTPTC